MRKISSAGITWLLAILSAAFVNGQVKSSTTDRPVDAAKRNLTIDDFFQIKRVQDPQISPDGKWVAYSVGSTSLKDEKSENQIWMIPTAGGEAIPMTMKGSSASSPRWSPNGKYLAFISARGEAKAQVWLLNRLGGEAQQLTEVKQGVSSFEWSPDSGRILLTIQDARPEDLQPENKDAPKPKTTTQPPWVIDRLQFKQDTVGYLDHRRTHFFVFEMATKKATQVTSGDFDDSQPQWSPDSKSIAFVSNREDDADASYNTDVWVVDANNTDQGKSLKKIT